jgi:hypothetical protein
MVSGDATAVSVARPPAAKSSALARDKARDGELVLASRRTSVLALLAIAAFALFVRARGIAWLLPMHVNPDEHVFAEQLELMRSGGSAPELDPRYGYYPHLVPRVAWIATSLVRAERPADDATLTPAEHLTAASRDLVVLRAVVAGLSLLVVPATYLLARRFLARPAALLAAALAATSSLHQWYSTQARPHGAAAALALVAVLAALEVRRRGDARSYLLAGVASGLALGSLQSGFIVLLPLFVAHTLRNREGSRRAWLWLGCALAISAVSFRAFYPFVFAPGASELAGNHVLGAADVGGTRFGGLGFAILLKTLVDYDPWILALASAGVLWLAIRARHEPRRGRDDLFVVLAYAIPYVIAFGAYDRTEARYAIPLLPYLACLGACATALAARWASHVATAPSARRAVAAAVFVIAFAVQASAACRIAAVRAAPDTATLAARWIQAHLDPARDRLAVTPSLELPLLRDADSLRDAPTSLEGTLDPWLVYQARLARGTVVHDAWSISNLPLRPPAAFDALVRDPLAVLCSMRCDYVAVEAFEQRGYDRLLAAVRASCELVVRFPSASAASARDDATFLAADVMRPRVAWGALVRTALRVDALGPTVEIYRVPR